MNGMTGRVYQALQGMGAVVTRGWPQADVPAPSVSYAQTISAWDEASGLHRYGYRLTVRAAAPEDCDAAAQEADGRMRALGFARRACFDGAEGNGGSFLKTMDYEGLFGAEGLPPRWICPRMLRRTPNPVSFWRSWRYSALSVVRGRAPSATVMMQCFLPRTYESATSRATSSSVKGISGIQTISAPPAIPAIKVR